MKSDYIKACLSAYTRFKYGCGVMATEVGNFSADFVMYRKGQLLEVEIKTSKSDLLADFRKDKHKIYKTGKHHWIPNFFYFAVPKELVEVALLKGLNYGYGVMVIDEHGMYKDRVRILRRAKPIHVRSVNDKVKRAIVQRLASEMANLRINSIKDS